MDIEQIYNALNSLAVLIRDGIDNSEKFLAVGKFDDMIFLNDDTIVNDEIDDMLTDLAHDLEYYNPNSVDTCFYGDKEFFEKLNPVLEMLKMVMERGSHEKS